MVNAYNDMVKRPGFGRGLDLTSSLARLVRESELGIGIFERDAEELYLVEDLAVVYGGITRVYHDIPNYGRTTTTNPEPVPHDEPIVLVEATNAGYKRSHHEPHEKIPIFED
jgi:hypothetical protein